MKNYDLSSVTFVLSGAAPVSVELLDQLGGVFPGALIDQGYGQDSDIPSSQQLGLIISQI